MLLLLLHGYECVLTPLELNPIFDFKFNTKLETKRRRLFTAAFFYVFHAPSRPLPPPPRVENY